MLGQRHGTHCIQRCALRIEPRLPSCLNQGRITPLTRCIFRALALHIARIDGADLEGNAVPGTQLLTVPLKFISRRLQTVVHMNRPHPPRPARMAGQQQSRRIGSAAKGHGQWQRRLECRHRCIHPSSRGPQQVSI